MKDLFSPITVSSLFCYFAVLYNLCALFLTAARIAAKTGKCASIQMNCTHNKPVVPPNVLFIIDCCVIVVYFCLFLYSFFFISYFVKKITKKLELLSPFCHVFLYFFVFCCY